MRGENVATELAAGELLTAVYLTFSSSSSDDLSLPSPNIFRLLGLAVGTGGGVGMPFFNDAPGGRSTVSMFDVDETNVGSPMSALDTVFLRRIAPFGLPIGTWGAFTAGALLVDGFATYEGRKFNSCADEYDAGVSIPDCAPAGVNCPLSVPASAGCVGLASK